MGKKQETIHSKIIRLFDGKASTSEKKEIKSWLDQSSENQKLYADLQEIWLVYGVEKNVDAYDKEYAIDKFRQKIRDHKKVRSLRIRQTLRYAAVIVLMASLPLTFFMGRNASSEIGGITTISSAYGDKANVSLPDGTIVDLNSGSKLTFNHDINSGFRIVHLEGEAYFSVKRDEKLPFKVITPHVEVEVLGTEFNLRAYPEDQTISATLVEGSIAVKTSLEEVVLEPFQKAVLNLENQKLSTETLQDVAPEIEWKDGRLVFRNESLASLEPILERWFDVDIEFADEEVKARRFTGILERESILEAISYFGYSRYVGYTIENNVITFYSTN